MKGQNSIGRAIAALYIQMFVTGCKALFALNKQIRRRRPIVNLSLPSPGLHTQMLLEDCLEAKSNVPDLMQVALFNDNHNGTG